MLQASGVISNYTVFDDNCDCPKLYDWLLAFPQEVEYIWRASWNWSKVLYLLTRYTPFVTIAVALRSELLFHWFAQLPTHFPLSFNRAPPTEWSG